MPWLDAVQRWPMAGTITWQLLSDTDPAKWAALLDAAQHHALRVDTAQAALAEASHEIAAAADWAAIAKGIQRWNDARIPRKGADVA